MVKSFPDQKEYLKKYLAGNKQKTKKKKSLNILKGVKLIDDDEMVKPVDLKDENIFLDGEEAPQIVLGEGVDPSILQDTLKKWKSISIMQTKVEEKSKFLKNFSVVKSPSTNKLNDEENDFNCNEKQLFKNESSSEDKKSINDINNDLLISDKISTNKPSPSRLSNSNSLHIRVREKRNSKDFSPKRKQIKRNEDSSFSRRNESINDMSPHRRKDIEKRSKSRDFDPVEVLRRNSCKDMSPSRKSKSSRNEFALQHRKCSRWDNPNKREGRDDSLPAEENRRSLSSEQPIQATDIAKKNYRRQLSPLERNDTNRNLNIKYKNRDSKHLSATKIRAVSIDLSPQRVKYKEKDKINKDYSPKTNIDSSFENSKSSSRSNSRARGNNSSPNRLKKSYKKEKTDDNHTLKMADGKLSGLRKYKDLQEDLKEFREREKEMLKRPSVETGQFAEPVIRSHARHKPESIEDKIKNKKKDEENEKKQEVYNRWGKGLKQIEDHKAKMVEHEYESSKPLARYADDKDLDKMLKQVEREGDPMLEYLRSKEKKSAKQKLLELPIYKGNYSENRYGIRPGYRWDGVDRSNGYEQKYFEKQNAKKALEDEAYRYSTEDM